MVGRNQHYIPSFLQRPFGIRPKRKEIWYFGRGLAAERRLIKRTASGNYFYSKPRGDGKETLDDAITNKESDLAALLKNVRTTTPGAAVAASTAAMIVSHLSQRTAHVRTTLSKGATRALEQTETMFTERAKIESYIGLDGSAPSDRFREFITGGLDKRPEFSQLRIPRYVIERMAFLLSKENAEELLEQGAKLVSKELHDLRLQMTEIIRDSHNKALDEMMESSEYEELLKTLNWSVESGPATGAILPDCVVIAIGMDGISGNHLVIGGKEMGAIVLAIAPDKLLVGLKPGFSLPRDFEYNVEAAFHSQSFFLAPRNDEETARLHASVGEKLRTALENAFEGGIDDFVATKVNAKQPDNEKNIEAEAWKATVGGRYELSLIGCGDQHTANRIIEDVADLVRELASAMPLDRLDGISIGRDYHSLLKNIDRGWENASTPETVPPEVGVGFAQNVTVKRSGVAKGHIVLSSIVSDALVSEEVGQRSWGRHIFARLLASVALMEIVEDCLPGALLESLGDGITGWLYTSFVDGAPESYLASWMAATYGNPKQIVIDLRESLSATVAQMTEFVPKERNAYREHGDLEKLLGVAQPAIRRVLSVGANLSGHCVFTGESPVVGSSELESVLDRAGLRSWFGVYFDDLAKFHRRLGHWESFEEFLAFNIHAERLLWSLGMFPWEGPEGIRVEVPLGFELNTSIAKSVRP